jgi:lysophospholipase L1-like esterase
VFAPRYFPSRYFPSRYFAPRGATASASAYFPQHFFPRRYFAGRFFPNGADPAPGGVHAVPTTNLLARYVAGEGITITGSGVSQWDDLSGNGHHAVQASDGNRPSSRTVLGKASISFDGGRSLDLPATLTVDRQDCAVFVCHRARSLGGNGLTLVHFDSNSLDLSLYLASTTGTVRPSVYSGTDKGNTIRNGHGIQTMGAICSASDVVIVHDAETQTVAANAAGSFTGGFIGKRHDGTNHFLGDIYEVLVYDAAISDTARDEILAAFADAWGATSPTTTTWIGFEGDSLTDNNANSNKNDSSWPFQLASTTGLTVPKWFNNAVGGDQLQGMLTQTLLLDEVAANSHYANRIVFLWAGINDIGTGGRSAAQITADLDTWIADYQAAGAVVYVCTMTPYTALSGAQNTIRLAVNTHIRSTATPDGVLDLVADSRLATASDTTYFLGDQLHLTAAGNAVVAELALAKLRGDGYLPAYPLTADTGSVAVTGVMATLRRAWRLVADTTSLAVAGTIALLKRLFRIGADSGTVETMGGTATLTIDRRITADPGAVSVAGTSATLDYSGQTGPTPEQRKKQFLLMGVMKALLLALWSDHV